MNDNYSIFYEKNFNIYTIFCAIKYYSILETLFFFLYTTIIKTFLAPNLLIANKFHV